MVTLFNAHIRHTAHEGSHTGMEDHNVEGEIRGHHVYKTAWTPVIGQMLDVLAESAEIDGSNPFSRIRSVSRMSKISSTTYTPENTVHTPIIEVVLKMMIQ